MTRRAEKTLLDPDLPESTRAEIKAMIASMNEEADAAMAAMAVGEAAASAVQRLPETTNKPADRARELRKDRDEVLVRVWVDSEVTVREIKHRHGEPCASCATHQARHKSHNSIV